MPTIGSDCHLTLTHASINSGAAYGFLISPSSNYPEGIAIKREVFTDDAIPMKVWVYTDLILADDLINPDGSQHTDSRAVMYAKLIEYLSQQSGITLTFSIGLIAALGCIEYAATEKHYPNHSIIRMQLTNIETYFGVADTEDFNNSVWDGTLTWETSYWR